VALALPNCTTHVVAFYAVLRIGAIVVEHNPLYTRSELVHQLKDSGAKYAIFWDKTAAELGDGVSGTDVETLFNVDVSRDLPVVKRLLLKLPVAKARETKAALCAIPPSYAKSWVSLMGQAQAGLASEPVAAADDIAVIQYTGGTTGTPKGAVLTHRNLVANTVQGTAWTGADQNMGTEVVYGVLPFFHAFGLTLCLTYSLRIGATVVLFPKFDVDQFLAAHKKRPGTFLPAVPPMLSRLTTRAEEKGADLTSFKIALSGAMPLPQETAEAWERVTGGLVIEGYGMTESSPVALGNPVSPDRQPGRLGYPFPSTDAIIVDQDDHTKVLPLTERGELLVSGPQVFQGYWNRPEENEHVLVEIDGKTWLRTGDVVVMDETGSFKVVDRIKEMIITGGFKVFPSQVEEHVREMPEVSDVAIVGVPAGDLGERVVAAVVPADPGKPVSLKAIQDWCDDKLARYALPRELVVVEDLPRSQIGKVLRRVVREQILEGAAAKA
jgi:long-chain acyl-CoA synthetase